jgi:hypothetical protein
VDHEIESSILRGLIPLTPQEPPRAVVVVEAAVP